ncbi:MAG: hypothetical protein IJY58_05825 [Alphaproteobacteria bacterium]|nr:hypothetical protein [Alphaproteobacteria bacterium]
MKKKILLLAFLGLIAFVAACGSVYEREPVGIGADYSELKKSPCACLQLEKAPAVPEWFL